MRGFGHKITTCFGVCLAARHGHAGYTSGTPTFARKAFRPITSVRSRVAMVLSGHVRPSKSCSPRVFHAHAGWAQPCLCSPSPVFSPQLPVPILKLAVLLVAAGFGRLPWSCACWCSCCWSLRKSGWLGWGKRGKVASDILQRRIRYAGPWAHPDARARINRMLEENLWLASP